MCPTTCDQTSLGNNASASRGVPGFIFRTRKPPASPVAVGGTKAYGAPGRKLTRTHKTRGKKTAINSP
jgi:hypothetical protein